MAVALPGIAYCRNCTDYPSTASHALPARPWFRLRDNLHHHLSVWRELEKEIEAELKKVDNALSMFNKQSVIAKVNRNEDLRVNAMFADVFRLAQTVSKETNGAFDITVAPLVNAWGFGFKSGNMPTQLQVDSILRYVGFQKVSLKEGRNGEMTINKTLPGIMLDCSAIAKGYGADCVARLLSSKRC